MRICGNRACRAPIGPEEDVVIAAELSDVTGPGDLVRTYVEGQLDLFHAGHVSYGWRPKRRGQLRNLERQAARA